MKTTSYIFSYLLGIGMIAGSISCTRESGHAPEPVFAEEGLPVTLSLGQAAAIPADLSASLYVFSRPKNSTSAYTLENSIADLRAESRLKFSNKNLNERNYRFLFTAGSPAAQSLMVQTASSASPVSGTSWADIRLMPKGELLSSDNYYQVKDINGTALLSTDSISGELTRIVGQAVFDFFKIGASLDDPRDINTKAVTSVFDRISRIEIHYSGITTALAFDENGLPVPASVSGEQQTQEITNTLARFRLNLPTTDIDTLQGGIAKGGCINGLYLLPSEKNIRTAITFYYYDTTPTCGPETHVHTETCYIQNSLDLQIPAATASSGLPIIPDAFTVNKIGIKCDRIIDIGYGSGFALDAEWKY